MVLQIFCSQGFSIAIQKGRNSAKTRTEKKKIGARLFFMLIPYIKFQVPSSKSVTDGWTDRPHIQMYTSVSHSKYPCVSKIRVWTHKGTLYVLFDKQISRLVCLQNKSH